MVEHSFELKGEFIPLIALLKATGLASTGGHARIIVEDGLVRVNGELEERKRKKLRKGDKVLVEGNQINIQ